MNVLVLNAGSSTLKFQLLRTDQERMAANADERLARGQYERIGGETIYAFSTKDGPAMRGTAPHGSDRRPLFTPACWPGARSGDARKCGVVAALFVRCSCAVRARRG